ncbi:hypothetical protein [Mageeibacillus indolicus]|uniref:Uncharacterized protein n=2 Tax=Mageeibacillus indolicus TaxID=884684 RepID=D3R222_MAGIU|nr:hypothetical protein [Mageeibacillus indolicus]ADC91513.1 hypothetical protein HMPREF0868_0920 [Mageeibacillus indolicus UPII9-5]KFA57406.1 hypothetical protein HMPREF1632_01775 [Mageeibacillus indolicus 0009-5]PNH19713.1 hypothetical protein B7R76_02195 [Mageeibacillus indolicus]
MQVLILVFPYAGRRCQQLYPRFQPTPKNLLAALKTCENDLFAHSSHFSPALSCHWEWNRIPHDTVAEFMAALPTSTVWGKAKISCNQNWYSPYWQNIDFTDQYRSILAKYAPDKIYVIGSLNYFLLKRILVSHEYTAI